MNNDKNSGLVFPYGAPTLSGIIKAEPQDFKVFEKLNFQPSGQGEHLFILVEKKLLTTPELISLIAADIGIEPKNIGYSGLKDKHAVTRQWLSLQLPGIKTIPKFTSHAHYQVLDSRWHNRKLRKGFHKTNRFEVLIRNISGHSGALQDQIRMITQSGFANYFGRQRFGRQQYNVIRAIETFNHHHKAKRLSRTKKSLYISALRSEVFNRILSARIGQGIWEEPVDGDVFMLAGSSSFFQEPLNELLRQRYRDQDIHCGLPLVGKGSSAAKGLAKTIETSVFTQQHNILKTLSEQGIALDYRANRGIVTDLVTFYDAENKTLQVNVELEKGNYMTSLLDHFILTMEQ